MAEYKVVDATQLDSGLASVAEAIRTKGNTTENLEFPNGFVDAVNAIESGGDSEPPANAKFQVVKYAEDGYPLEVNLCSEGDTKSPNYGFSYNASYISPYWLKVEKINFPSTVVSIGEYGLLGLKGLKEVTSWDNIESIDRYGFYGCISLEYDYLPPKLTEITTYSFSSSRLPITELPPGIITIGNSAFDFCSYNMDIKKLPSNLISVGSRAFNNNGLATVSFSEIPASVQTIGNSAFRGACKGIVGSLTFKGTPSSIAADAFEMGTNVTDIYVPWAEGAVANAPWGMTNATIHYNSEV